MSLKEYKSSANLESELLYQQLSLQSMNKKECLISFHPMLNLTHIIWKQKSTNKVEATSIIIIQPPQ